VFSLCLCLSEAPVSRRAVNRRYGHWVFHLPADVDTAGRFCKRLAQDIAKVSQSRRPGLLLPQDPEDLLSSEPGSLHPSVPSPGRTPIVPGGVSGGHVVTL